jgi:hypothetical protein
MNAIRSGSFFRRYPVAAWIDAGAIASRSGIAMLTPTPRNAVLLESWFLIGSLLIRAAETQDFSQFLQQQSQNGLHQVEVA